MINRKAFFEIFFYNRENPSRELLETAESVWRAYMQKYGLGLDASTNGEPTYEEVKEITYLANYAIEMMAAKEAAAAAPAPMAPVEEPEEVYEEPPKEVEAAPAEPQEEPAEEILEEEPAEKSAEEETEETPEEVPAAPAQEIPEKTEEETPPPPPAVIEKAPVPRKPAKPTAAVGSDTNLWVEQLIQWCESKGFQCICSMDGGDCYLHVYLPYKKEVLPVGKWCLKAQTNGADLAAEISKLYAYCTGYADCFAQLTR